MSDMGILLGTFPRTSHLRTVLAMALLSAFAGLAGCSDNRVSLRTFMSMQKQGPQAPASQAAAEPVSQESAGIPAAPAPETQPAGETADHLWSPYKVGPGDVLGITMTGVGEGGTVAPILARVHRDGDIDLPLAGKIHVAGLELQDVEDAIQNAYVPRVYQQASIHVELTKPEVASVLVTGAVVQPGLVQLPRTQRNLLFAIAGAGGISNLASGEVVLRRLREPGEVKFNLLKPEQLQQALTMGPLQNGDTVVVQAATPNVIFIGGLVLAPHVQVNPPGTTMNVLQALASAGGLRTDVTPTEITLIRRMPDGKDVHVKLNVDRIQRGSDPNINLAPGDILWVPDTLLTAAENWVNQNVFFKAGFNVVGTYSFNGLDFMNNNAKQAALGTFNNNNIQNTVDPLGFLSRQQQLNNIQNQLPSP